MAMPTESTNPTRPTILLVDDEELLRRLMGRMLIEAGFGVVEAENGAAALEAVERLNGGLRLVVTDIHMPVMTGPEFARELRTTHPDIPILYISGRDAGASLGRGVPKGPLLRKPFRTETLIETVERLIGPPL